MPGKSKAQQAAEAELPAPTVYGETLYSPRLATRIKQFAMVGATNDEIASFIGVSISTFEAWTREKPPIKRALSKGRELADVRVAGALHRRATGFRANAQKVMVVAGKPQVVEYKEYYPPETRAAELWLTNKRPAQWRAKGGGEAAGNVSLLDLVRASFGELAKTVIDQPALPAPTSPGAEPDDE